MSHLMPVRWKGIFAPLGMFSCVCAEAMLSGVILSRDTLWQFRITVKHQLRRAH